MDNFYFNSNYPVDKIIYLKETTVSGDYFDNTFAHGLGAIPFCNGLISYDNWQTTYQAGTRQSAGQYYNKMFDIYSDGTNIRLNGTFEGFTGTAQVRIWGVFNESSTPNVDVAPTASATNNTLYFNTKYNYQKLVKEGQVTAGSTATVISHNLGYIPKVDIWQLFSSYISGWCLVQDTYSFSNTNLQNVQLSNSSLLLKNGTYYYRIYA